MMEAASLKRDSIFRAVAGGSFLVRNFAMQSEIDGAVIQKNTNCTQVLFCIGVFQCIVLEIISFTSLRWLMY